MTEDQNKNQDKRNRDTGIEDRSDRNKSNKSRSGMKLSIPRIAGKGSRRGIDSGTRPDLEKDVSRHISDESGSDSHHSRRGLLHRRRPSGQTRNTIVHGDDSSVHSGSSVHGDGSSVHSGSSVHRSSSSGHRRHHGIHNRSEYRFYRKVGRTLALGMLLTLLIILAFFIRSCSSNSGRKTSKEAENQQNEVIDSQNTEQESKSTDSSTGTSQNPEKKKAVIRNPEDDIYTFLQGPQAWENQMPWAGTWNSVVLENNYFSDFGCGLCCMANIYSSLTPYECSPLDMYDFAKEASDYAPYEGLGAISWAQMLDTLIAAGFDCECCLKPDTYEEFREMMKESEAAIALVSSKNDSSFWNDTEGHYVTLFLYDDETQQVLLGDSGHPDYNRDWISLETVYSALKTDNIYQFLLVKSYSEDNNCWKYSGIAEEWVIPDYYESKAVGD